MKIEIYTNLYKQSVADLILGIQRDEFQIPITLEMQPDLQEIPAFYQAGNGNFWIAKEGENIIGTIALLDIGNKQVALRKMFVAPPYRGKPFGAGQALLDTAITWAKQQRIHDIFLGTTEKFKAAQRFYEKNGFIELPKHQLPAEFPVMDVDVKFYRFGVQLYNSSTANK